jgi:predicted  nucleic acid-binding Zn-ribbon protein
MSTGGLDGQINNKRTTLDQLDGNKTTTNNSIKTTSQKVDFTKMEYIEGHDLLNSLVQINRIEHTGSEAAFNSALGLQGTSQGNLDSAILAETQAASDKSNYEQNLTNMLSASDAAFGNLTTQLGIVDTTQANLNDATALQGNAREFLGAILNNHANMSTNLDLATSNHAVAQDGVTSATQTVTDSKSFHSDAQGFLAVAQDGERTAADSLQGAKVGVTNAKGAHGKAETGKAEAATAVSGASATLSAANVNKAGVEGELREAENAKSGNPVRRFLNWCASKISDLINSIKDKLSKATREVQDAEKNLQQANERANEAGDTLLEAFSNLMDAEEFEKLQEEYLAAAKDGVEAQQQVLENAFNALKENEEALVAADANLAAMFATLNEAKTAFDEAVQGVINAQEQLEQAVTNVAERRAAFENAQGVRDEYLEIHEQKMDDADRAQELDDAAAIILAGARGEVDTASQEYLDAVAAVEAAREETERLRAEGTALNDDMNGLGQHYNTLLSSLEDVISGKKVNLDDIEAQMTTLQDEIAALEEQIEAEAALIAQLQARQANANGENGGLAQIGDALFSDRNADLADIAALEAAIASNDPQLLQEVQMRLNLGDFAESQGITPRQAEDMRRFSAQAGVTMEQALALDRFAADNKGVSRNVAAEDFHRVVNNETYFFSTVFKDDFETINNIAHGEKPEWMVNEIAAFERETGMTVRFDNNISRETLEYNLDQIREYQRLHEDSGMVYSTDICVTNLLDSFAGGVYTGAHPDTIFSRPYTYDFFLRVLNHENAHFADRDNLSRDDIPEEALDNINRNIRDYATTNRNEFIACLYEEIFREDGGRNRYYIAETPEGTFLRSYSGNVSQEELEQIAQLYIQFGGPELRQIRELPPDEEVVSTGGMKGLMAAARGLKGEEGSSEPATITREVRYTEARLY